MAIRTTEILLSAQEVADMLGLSTASIRQYVGRKLIVPLAKIGRSHVFTKSECERFKRSKQPRGNPNFTKSAADVPASRRRKTKTAAKA